MTSPFRDARGIISLTNAAKLTLRLPLRRCATKLVDEIRERDEILDAERAPAGRQHNERIDVASVRPAPRERALHALLIEERHAILTPRLANRHKHELAAAPRMERMRHTDSSLRYRPIKRSRRRRRRAALRRR